MKNNYNLTDIIVLKVIELEVEHHIYAEITRVASKCLHCHSSDIVKFGHCSLVDGLRNFIKEREFGGL